MTVQGQPTGFGPRRASFWLRLVGDEAVDPRRRAARLAVVVHTPLVLAPAAALALAPGAPRGVLLAALAVGLGTLAASLLPWERWPERALLWLSVGGWLGLALLVVGLGGQLEQVLPLYVLEFSLLGLTQPGNRALAMGAAAFGSGAFAALVAHRPAGIVALGLVDVVGVITAQILAAHLARRREAELGFQLVLTGVSTLTSATTLGELGDLTAHYSAQLFGAHAVLVLLPTGPQSRRLTNVNTRRSPEPAGDIVLTGDEAPLLSRVLGRSRAVLAQPGADDALLCPNDVERFHIASALFVPMLDGRQALGVLAIFWHTRQYRVDPLLVQGIELLAGEAAKAARRVWQTESLTREATTDPLTGLENRRGFQTRLASLQPGDSVVFLDLDHFKVLNDTLGHVEGDTELVAFAATLLREVRGQDCAARYGGEEFVLLLRRGGHEGTRRVLTAVRQRWADVGRTTFSAGIAVHTGHRPPAETLLRADQALYESKRQGRDRLTWYAADQAAAGA